MDGSFGSLHVRQEHIRKGGPHVIGLLLIILGLIAGVVGWLLLRRSGTAWRVGRLLAAAPQRSLAEAAAVAAADEPAYVRIHGRIDSDEEFPGEDDRPLVFRRRRLQRGVAGAAGRVTWQTLDDERVAVPFGLRERGERVSIDVDALGDGLVVVPRVSEGVAADLPADTVSGSLPSLPADARVRLRLEQVSTVDHGTACGVPRLGPSGRTLLGPGLGRPLILTNLDPAEAMRVLGAEERTGLRVAAVLLVAAPFLLAAGLVLMLLRL